MGGNAWFEHLIKHNRQEHGMTAEQAAQKAIEEFIHVQEFVTLKLIDKQHQPLSNSVIKIIPKLSRSRHARLF